VSGLVKTLHPLRLRERPFFEEGTEQLRIIDLFCGCGGLSLGVAQAAQERFIALDIALAIDSDESALEVFRANFPKANTMSSGVESLFSKTSGRAPLKVELKLRREIGTVHALVGGPPCQGHSNLNNHTRRTDPRNDLYLRMVRAAEVFLPPVVLIENVPAVLHSSSGVIKRSSTILRKNGYDVQDAVIALTKLGVPQSRRRHVLLATRIRGLTSSAVMADILNHEAAQHDLRWAIGDLLGLQRSSIIDIHPQASAANLSRMKKMLKYGWYDLPNRYRPPCINLRVTRISQCTDGSTGRSLRKRSLEVSPRSAKGVSCIPKRRER